MRVIWIVLLCGAVSVLATYLTIQWVASVICP